MFFNVIIIIFSFSVIIVACIFYWLKLKWYSNLWIIFSVFINPNDLQKDCGFFFSVSDNAQYGFQDRTQNRFHEVFTCEYLFQPFLLSLSFVIFEPFHVRITLWLEDLEYVPLLYGHPSSIAAASSNGRTQSCLSISGVIPAMSTTADCCIPVVIAVTRRKFFLHWYWNSMFFTIPHRSFQLWQHQILS